MKKIDAPWVGASLPAFGESSYCLVLKGTNLHKFNKQYPQKRVRRTTVATRPFVACLRRYYLSRGSREAENASWSYPASNPIRPKPIVFYTIPGFASFTDAAEAFCYSAVLKAYYAGSDFKVIQFTR